jgi:hypothetical protein
VLFPLVCNEFDSVVDGINNRGGVRSGAGRKPSPDTETRKSFSVAIPDYLFLKIETYCKSRGCSLNQYIIDSIKMRQNK